MAKKRQTTSEQVKTRSPIRERISRKGDNLHERANVSMRPPRKPHTSGGQGGSNDQKPTSSKPEANGGNSGGNESNKK